MFGRSSSMTSPNDGYGLFSRAPAAGSGTGGIGMLPWKKPVLPQVGTGPADMPIGDGSTNMGITPGSIKPPGSNIPPPPQQPAQNEPQFLPMGQAPLAPRGRYRVGGGAWQQYGDNSPYWSSGEMFVGRQLNPNWKPPTYPGPGGPADMGIGSGDMGSTNMGITPGSIKPPGGVNPGGGMIVPPVGGGGPR